MTVSVVEGFDFRSLQPEEMKFNVARSWQRLSSEFFPGILSEKPPECRFVSAVRVEDLDQKAFRQQFMENLYHQLPSKTTEAMKSLEDPFSHFLNLSAKSKKNKKDVDLIQQSFLNDVLNMLHTSVQNTAAYHDPVTNHDKENAGTLVFPYSFAESTAWSLFFGLYQSVFVEGVPLFLNYFPQTLENIRDEVFVNGDKIKEGKYYISLSQLYADYLEDPSDEKLIAWFVTNAMKAGEVTEGEEKDEGLVKFFRKVVPEAQKYGILKEGADIKQLDSGSTRGDSKRENLRKSVQKYAQNYNLTYSQAVQTVYEVSGFIKTVKAVVEKYGVDSEKGTEVLYLLLLGGLDDINSSGFTELSLLRDTLQVLISEFQASFSFNINLVSGAIPEVQKSYGTHEAAHAAITQLRKLKGINQRTSDHRYLFYEEAIVESISELIHFENPVGGNLDMAARSCSLELERMDPYDRLAYIEEILDYADKISSETQRSSSKKV